MLQRLEVQNLALIKNAGLNLDKGFNVITGETGAGKSLLIGAIQAISGQRLNKDLVRRDAESALVEAIFDITDSQNSQNLKAEFNHQVNSATLSNELTLSREIMAEGRSYARLDGRLVPLATLKEVTNDLIAIHGQYDSQQIFNPAAHAPLLLKYYLQKFSVQNAGEVEAKIDSSNNDTNVYQAYLDSLEAFNTVKQELNKLQLPSEELQHQKMWLEFQINEIKKADIRIGEEEALRKRNKRLQSIEKLGQALQGIRQILDDGEFPGALSLLRPLSRELNNIAPVMTKAGLNIEKVDAAMETLNEVSQIVEKLSLKLDYSPNEQEEIAARLDVLSRLKKKYGSSEADILSFLSKAETDLDNIINSEERRSELALVLKDKRNHLKLAGAALAKQLRRAAGALSEQINHELADLDMQQARFEVSFGKVNLDHAGIYGIEPIEFLIAANQGEGAKPLAQSASGGEAARIMLAIKVILAEIDSVKVLIFDEIDAGISGETAARVGEKLVNLSRNVQVLCVTHSAYIASMADQHYLIYKHEQEGRTQTDLINLDMEGRQKEIARLLAGDAERNLSEQLAASLIAKAKAYRSQLQMF